MDLSGSRRQRARKLSRKIASSPVLPVLGTTKAVETVITGYTPSNRTQSALEALGLEY